MRRFFLLTSTVAMLLVPAAARADHVPPQLGIVPGSLPAPPPLLSEGPIRHITHLSTGRSFAGTFGEVPTFERDGKRYMVAGSSVYGFSVIDVTDPLSPFVVSEYASAFGCPGSALMQLQEGDPDPIGIALGYGGFENDISASPDGEWVVLGMDEPGRCHDPIYGGIEIVNVSDVTNPTLVHLVRNTGQAHSVTLDPSRPWLAYISTSDSEDVLPIVDFSQCMEVPAAECRPTVSEAVFDWDYMPALFDKETEEDRATDGCHDVRFFRGYAYCAAVGSTLILDVSRVLRSDGRLSGTRLTEGANACEVVDADPIYAPGIKVTDCRNWHKDVFRDRKAQVADIPLLAPIVHGGVDTTDPPTETIQVAHQAEAIADGRIMMVTDERGGGLGTDECPGGGVWFYDIRDPSKPVLMRQPDGSPAVYLTQWNIPSILGMNPSCTVHYGREFADENLLTFGWYSNGMRVLRYYADFTKSPAEIRFEEIAGFASLDLTFESMILQRNPENPDEVLVYASNGLRGIDVWAVEAPRVTRAAAIKGAPVSQAPEPKPKVGGTKTTRPGPALPGTGVGDPGVIALVLLALAMAVRSLTRKTTR